MLFRTRDLEALRRGTLTLAFRCWRRPSVREGGTLMAPVGTVPIVSLRPVVPAAITAAEARRAGLASRDDLLATLSMQPDGVVSRIELGPVRPDPRVALRESPPSTAELDDLQETLDRIDDRATDEAWTRLVLEVLRTNPGVRALKGLGLTESLEAGYRLSPRGAALLAALGPDGASA